MAKQQVSSIDNAKNATYQVNGLTYASNIATVNKRDTAGNLSYQEGDDNALLIIEPVRENVTTASVIKVVNTQFSYFMFPARTTVEAAEDFDLGIDPNDFIVNLEEFSQPDALPARYRPTLDQQIPKSTTFQTLEFATVVSGQTQTEVNSFSVTQKVLDEVTTQINVTGLLKTYYSANLDSELLFAVMEYDNQGALVGRVSPVIKPTVGPKFDNGNPTKEGDYESTINFTIEKSKLTLGHTYRVAGMTDRQTDKRNHTLYALDSYINFAAE